MSYNTLKALVNSKVYENTEQRITGGDMNTVLQSAIASLGAHYQMGGLVSPADQITVGDEPVVFLATTPGTYTYFGGIVVADGEVALLVWSGTAWSKQTPDIATGTEVSQLGQKVGEFPALSKDDAENTTYHAINSDGSLDYTSSYRAYYYTNNNYKRVTATLGCNATGNYAIAFYNSATPDSTSFVGGVKTQNSASYTVSADVPDGCVLIIVSNRNLTNNNPTIGIFVNPIVTLEKQESGGAMMKVGLVNLETIALQDETARALGKKLKTKDDAENTTYHGINSDGSLSSSSSYRAYYYKNNGYYKVFATLAGNNTADIAIGFYNSDTPSSSSFISGVNAKNAFSFDVEGIVPEGCVLIIVSNRNVLNPNPVISIFGKPSTILSDNPNGGKDLMVGDYNAGTVAMESEIAPLREVVNNATVVTDSIHDERLQDIRWNKIFDTAGLIYDDAQTFLTAKFPCKQNDVIVVNAHGYKTGIAMILRNSSGAKLDYWNLNVEKTINVTYSTASYFECAFLKTGYGATVSVNGKTVFTWTKEMADYLSTVYEENLAFEDVISSLALRCTKAIKDNSIVFVHLTDTHSGYPNHMSLANAEKHMRMAMRLAERVKADFVVHTGDAIHGFSEKADPAMDSYNALLEKVGESSIPLIWAQGNPSHDFGYGNELSRSQVNTIMGRFGKWITQNAIYGDTRSYYYFDMSRTPCRVLILDPDDGGVNRIGYGFSNEQVAFVNSALSDALTKGLPIAIFAHMPLTGKLIPPYSIDGSAIELEIKSYVNGGGKVLCYSFGHTHWDNYYYDKPNGIPYINLVNEFPISELIGTQPEWGRATSPLREMGKLSEYAMDVYVIDVVTGIARIFRYGAGNGRISNIADFTASIGETVTLTSELTSPTWSSLNEDIATVANGVVTGVSVGDAEIIATDANGAMEFFKVTIS